MPANAAMWMEPLLTRGYERSAQCFCLRVLPPPHHPTPPQPLPIPQSNCIKKIRDGWRLQMDCDTTQPTGQIASRQTTATLPMLLARQLHAVRSFQLHVRQLRSMSMKFWKTTISAWQPGRHVHKARLWLSRTCSHQKHSCCQTVERLILPMSCKQSEHHASKTGFTKWTNFDTHSIVSSHG